MSGMYRYTVFVETRINSFDESNVATKKEALHKARKLHREGNYAGVPILRVGVYDERKNTLVYENGKMF
jgi:hypothetical protein